MNQDKPSESEKRALVGSIAFGFFKIIPMLVAGLSIYLGYDLFIKGVTGQASLVGSVSSAGPTIQGQLINAAPGLFFAVGGFALVIVTILKGYGEKPQK